MFYMILNIFGGQNVNKIRSLIVFFSYINIILINSPRFQAITSMWVSLVQLSFGFDVSSLLFIDLVKVVWRLFKMVCSALGLKKN